MSIYLDASVVGGGQHYVKVIVIVMVMVRGVRVRARLRSP